MSTIPPQFQDPNAPRPPDRKALLLPFIAVDMLLVMAFVVTLITRALPLLPTVVGFALAIAINSMVFVVRMTQARQREQKPKDPFQP
jgi:Flp pilus assembly protein TadB